MHPRTESPLGPMVDRIAASFPLREPEQRALLDMPCSVQRLPRGQILLAEGAFSPDIRVLLSGVACSYRSSSHGKRIVTAVHADGDILNFEAAFTTRGTSGARLLTGGSAASVPSRIFVALALEMPRLGLAFWQASAAREAIASSWAANIGRDGSARLARLLLELALAIEAAGEASREQFDLPMTLDEVAEAIGLCSPHVSRLFHGFEASKLVRRRGHHMEILAWERLAAVGELSGPGAGEQAYIGPDVFQTDKVQAGV